MRKDHVFPVLAFFALVSCDCASADFRALTQESPDPVAVGDTAVLRCYTSVPEELTEVRWIRIQAGHYSIINIFKEGRDQQRCDLPEYIGRTEVMRDGLAHGCAALKVFNVSVADEVTYRCYLGTVNYFDFGDLNLTVTALGSHPRIDIEAFQDGGIKVVCKSVGWYPEPMLVNKDDDGKMKIRKEANGFYSVEYSRVITENSDRTISCMFRTQFPKQEWVTSVYVAAIDLDKTQSVTKKNINRKKEEPFGCVSSPVTQALLPLDPDSKDASSEGNMEMLHLKLPLEPGSSDAALTRSEDL